MGTGSVGMDQGTLRPWLAGVNSARRRLRPRPEVGRNGLSGNGPSGNGPSGNGLSGNCLCENGPCGNGQPDPRSVERAASLSRAQSLGRRHMQPQAPARQTDAQHTSKQAHSHAHAQPCAGARAHSYARGRRAGSSCLSTRSWRSATERTPAALKRIRCRLSMFSRL